MRSQLEFYGEKVSLVVTQTRPDFKLLIKPRGEELPLNFDRHSRRFFRTDIQLGDGHGLLRGFPQVENQFHQPNERASIGDYV